MFPNTEQQTLTARGSIRFCTRRRLPSPLSHISYHQHGETVSGPLAPAAGGPVVRCWWGAGCSTCATGTQDSATGRRLRGCCRVTPVAAMSHRVLATRGGAVSHARLGGAAGCHDVSHATTAAPRRLRCDAVSFSRLCVIACGRVWSRDQQRSSHPSIVCCVRAWGARELADRRALSSVRPPACQLTQRLEPAR